MKKIKLKIGKLQFSILRILWRSRIPLKAHEIHSIVKEKSSQRKYFCTWMSLQLLCNRNLASVENGRYSITSLGSMEYLHRI